MAAETINEQEKAKKQKPREITFKCQWCEKNRLLKDMVCVTRYRPVLVVCQDCAKELR
ncbi:MAG TPA: hypothetical protein VMW86_07105 [Dehalococcoidales bacterium]|nr:hypothetical protein [Dehalococcoidales bacterium]